MKIPSISETKLIEKAKLVVYLHFYNPIGPGDWYVLAQDGLGSKCTYYGLVIIKTPVLKKFSHKELIEIKLPFGLKILREKGFKPCKLSNLKKELRIP